MSTVRLQAKTAALYIALSASALLLGAQAARIDFFARKVRERNNCCPAHFFAFRPVLACEDKPAMSPHAVEPYLICRFLLSLDFCGALFIAALCKVQSSQKCLMLGGRDCRRSHHRFVAHPELRVHLRSSGASTPSLGAPWMLVANSGAASAASASSRVWRCCPGRSWPALRPELAGAAAVAAAAQHQQRQQQRQQQQQ